LLWEKLFVASPVIHAGRVRDEPRPTEPATEEIKEGAEADISEARENEETSEELPHPLREEQELADLLPHPLPPPLEGGAVELD
jgi:hypothetical protein